MLTNKKLIRSYDNFAASWTQRLRSGNNTALLFLEKPAMYRKIPNLKGKTVLCVGCGSGEECNYLRLHGAKKVIGIDISSKFIDLAKKSYPDIEFHVMDMEKILFANYSFDFVYSSLTMHYVADWTRSLKEIKRVLKVNGVFLFSTLHPVRWSGQFDRSEMKKSYLLGYERYTSGGCKIFGDYLNTRRVDDVWYNEYKVSYYYRPFSRIIMDIVRSGFIIADFIEPKATRGAIKRKRAFYDVHQKMPLFMIFELKKK